MFNHSLNKLFVNIVFCLIFEKMEFRVMDYVPLAALNWLKFQLIFKR